jgi:Leucine-rich repeat (LRR) protein
MAKCVFDCSRNQLQWLPPGICQLVSLQVLLLSDNRLARLPSDLGNLSELAELDVAANQLTMLPPSIGKLARLRHLNVRRNHLTQLPVGQFTIKWKHSQKMNTITIINYRDFLLNFDLFSDQEV